MQFPEARGNAMPHKGVNGVTRRRCQNPDHCPKRSAGGSACRGTLPSVQGVQSGWDQPLIPGCNPSGRLRYERANCIAA
jgi:hypothetical protein